ncbi:2-polyprenyl-6-methoxyphenol hydroxylase [Xylona heveae TC161]|uniref:2-polyprenyl-6-methoxyphenol hydroxylase n=1 Tax=Xylona heveae (strain CBS 132557 / TC161) TaxID=1328760 RepID=A0A165J757_XYLHT|nr:2-polyprenyl-6-methoxyphenol hydroxylase [Xylona heveae TC161]KZF25830.1 2-polyprenyl-6-methoxyphenol hydroxylase [Xylona heveae TC161]
MVPVQIKAQRGEESKLKIIVVGAGLGGLGAAIALLLAGHEVSVLECANEIAEVGAGIQVLPNCSRVLKSWGMGPALEKYATRPRGVNMMGWKGNLISSMSFHDSAAQYPGTCYWDFHRANLHGCLLERALELGANVRCRARVMNVEVIPDGATATVKLENGEQIDADLVVGADGINSRLREIMLGRPDPPTPTGDLAYRLLLSAKDIMKDPELASFVTDPQVNYWLGPDAHAVNYVLRGGELFNMVLLVPDDMPAGASTLEGNVEEMRAMYKDWDPRIPKFLKLCESVYKWRLCIRKGLDEWSHPSGAFTLLGDSVHATLPYLASGAGMALEDGAVLGECFSRIKDKSPASKKMALEVYENCRKRRTEMVVERGNMQQYLYHLRDGPEQEERDRRMRMKPTVAGEALAWRDPELAPKLLGYHHVKDVDEHWPQSISATGPTESFGMTIPRL